MRNLRDKTIIVTGASSGIGAATALACARAGMNCVLVARRRDLLEQVAESARQLGRRAVVLVADVADSESSDAMLDAAEREFGGFHAVFANAGYGISVPMDELPAEKLRRIFEVNFFAGVDLLQRAARRLLAAERSGHLLMTSSSLAHLTLPLHGAYCATKAAQRHVCRAMNLELKRRGIRVSSVHPVGTTTEFFEPPPGETSRRPVRMNTPRIFVQPPERVARAIVSCLRRPRPEVWTSFLFRVLAAGVTLWPRLGDVTGWRAFGPDERNSTKR